MLSPETLVSPTAYEANEAPRHAFRERSKDRDKFSRSLVTFLAERDQKQYKKKV